MKTTHIAALVLPALLAVAGCSNADQQAQDAANGANNAGGTADPADAGTVTSSGEGEEGGEGGTGSASPTEIPGADTATVKITTCEVGDNGVDIEADVTNTTDVARNYVIAVGVKNDKGENAGGGAVIAQVEPGKNATATGQAPSTAEGEVTCEVSNIGSVEG